MRVETDLINHWLDHNGPSALAKLALSAGVCTATIQRARTGMLPKRMATRRAIARAMNISDSVLFPAS